MQVFRRKGIQEEVCGRTNRSSKENVERRSFSRKTEKTKHPGSVCGDLPSWSPHIGGLLQKLHPVFHSSMRCKEAIPQVPMVAYRKPKSLAQYLVRARFTNTLKERIDGTLKCTSKNCQICKFLCLGNTFCSR